MSAQATEELKDVPKHLVATTLNPKPKKELRASGRRGPCLYLQTGTAPGLSQALKVQVFHRHQHLMSPGDKDYMLKLQNRAVIFGTKFGPQSQPHVLNCQLRMLQMEYITQTI